ncbi:zinc metalloproteinase nas-36 [Hyalella azteca]|uniref:Metalloendopeptidase n=1 Tax=Hyalella azteca TaxID=294128 RepID=A0A8B7PRW7_HYAAZ|nr:zinc metalloproteinase nas-36 [Hyalella azteca]
MNMTVLQEAIGAWEAATCIKFFEMEVLDERAEFMEFVGKKGCYASVGYRKGKNTRISVDTCAGRGVTHEIAHALGLQHEQSRSDRNDHIILVADNIEVGKEFNFALLKTVNYNIPYDYYSLMHYYDRAASGDDKRTMLARDPRFQLVMGDGKKISFWNAKLVNTAYGCIDDWLASCKQESEPCKNGGYTQKDCSCACPLGTTGDKCQVYNMSYRDALIKQISPYTSVITTSGTEVVSFGYPDDSPSAETKYTQIMRAPECHRAVVKFSDFELAPRNPTEDKICEFGSLEIRSDVTVAGGKLFCGKEIEKGTVFKSDKTDLIFHYKNPNFVQFGTENKYKGYKATFTVEPIPNCR